MLCYNGFDEYNNSIHYIAQNPRERRLSGACALTVTMYGKVKAYCHCSICQAICRYNAILYPLRQTVKKTKRSTFCAAPPFRVGMDNDNINIIPHYLHFFNTILKSPESCSSRGFFTSQKKRPDGRFF